MKSLVRERRTSSLECCTKSLTTSARQACRAYIPSSRHGLMTRMTGKNRRVAVFAFGTRGDVLPVAVVAAALARANASASITFITHAAHRNMEPHLAGSGVARFIAVSAPPVLPGRAVVDPSQAEIGAGEGDEELKAAREMELREECIAAMDSVIGAAEDGGGVIINLFALEGWHLAELYRVPCAVLAPYVVPYSAPSSFERRFRAAHPLLYRRLKQAAPGEVGWEEVMHWMWPLFTDRWASWRTSRLHLSACPLTDPVTDLPLLHAWPQASQLLYGFSPQVVECPAYWPRSVSVCGFWFAPVEWEARDSNAESAAPQATCHNATRSSNPKGALSNPVDRPSSLHTSFSPVDLKSSLQLCGKFAEVVHSPDTFLIEKISEDNPQLSVSRNTTQSSNYKPPEKLHRFLSDVSKQKPMFVGFSSMGSMGFLENPGSILKVLGAVLEATKSSAILLTAGHPALDLAVCEHCDEESLSRKCRNAEQSGNILRDGWSCFHGRLFCYSGSVAYSWLLPRCSVALHHGGSGTTAACLRAGVPQIICPFVLDQFYWAERMTWLGVAPQPLLSHHLMPEPTPTSSHSFGEAVKVLTAAVKEAIGGELDRCASALSAKLAGEDGTAMAVGILREILLT